MAMLALERQERNEQIETVRTACIKAREPVYAEMTEVSLRPIRLADVLLAIRKELNSYENGVQTPRESIAIDDLVNCRWDLEADDLTLQDDECVAFLANLLQ